MAGVSKTPKKVQQEIGYKLIVKEECANKLASEYGFNVKTITRYGEIYKDNHNIVDQIKKPKNIPDFLLDEWEEARLMVNPNAKERTYEIC